MNVKEMSDFELVKAWTEAIYNRVPMTPGDALDPGDALPREISAELLRRGIQSIPNPDAHGIDWHGGGKIFAYERLGGRVFTPAELRAITERRQKVMEFFWEHPVRSIHVGEIAREIGETVEDTEEACRHLAYNFRLSALAGNFFAMTHLNGREIR